MIHDNRDTPFAYSSEVYFGPGRKHRVSYTIKGGSFLGSPYSDCRDTIPYILAATYNHLGSTDYAYSASFCIIICLQIYT